MASQVRGGVGVGVRRAHLVGSIPAGSAEEAMDRIKLPLD